MLFSEFLLDRVGLTYGRFALKALDELAGEQVAGTIDFYDSADRVLSFLPPTTPIFFFPFAERHDDLIGFHLLPRRVEWERLVVATEDVRGIREIAANLPEYIHRELSYIEASYYEDGEDPAAVMRDQVARVNEAFGEDFYRPGRRGRFWTQDVDGMAFRSGWAMMSRHIECTYEYVGRGQIERAAKAFVLSMECYHHTSRLATYSDRHAAFQAYFELGRGLRAQAQKQFPEWVGRELSLSSDAEKVAWIAELCRNGQYELSLKALCDLCYVRHSSYQHPLIYDLLRAHFEKLEMGWAIALLRSRGVERDGGGYDDISAGLKRALVAVA